MKDHLLNDHMPVAKKSDLSVNSPSKLTNKVKSQSRRSEATPTSAKNSKMNSMDNKLKKLSDSPCLLKVKEDPDGVLKQKVTSLRKRRRSARFEDDLTADTCSTNSNLDSPANLYDFEEDQLADKSGIKDDMTNESSTNENNDANRPKKYRKYTKGRKSLANVRQSKLLGEQEILQNKKVQPNNNTLNVASADVDSSHNTTLTGEIKLETTTDIKAENTSPSKLVVPPQRRQKALKQTNIKNFDVNSKYHRRFKRFLEKARAEDSDYGYLTPKSPEIISTTLAGNVRFCANKNNFKCVECGDTDLKTHFK